MSAVYFGGAGGLQPGRGIPQRGRVHALDVLRDGVAAERHRAVDLREDLGAEPRRRSRPKLGGISRTTETSSDCRRVSASSAERAGGVPAK